MHWSIRNLFSKKIQTNQALVLRLYSIPLKFGLCDTMSFLLPYTKTSSKFHITTSKYGVIFGILNAV